MSAIIVRPLTKSDYPEWRRLWTAYLAFYETTLSDDVFQITWSRLFDPGEFEPKGFLAVIDAQPVGLVHYLYHRSGWSKANNCYLQDLFADPNIRGKGVGSALIEAVQREAAKVGAAKLYWMTHETNGTARRLYDRVARLPGFIIYELD